MTSHTAKEYLKHAGRATVVRILAGSYAGATANVSSQDTVTAGTKATGSIQFLKSGITASMDEITIGGVNSLKLKLWQN